MDNSPMVWIMGGVSVAVIVAGMIIVPRMILRMPADYFVRDKHDNDADKPAAGRTVLKIGKNVLGVALIIAGLAMLLLPGQGILTVVVGALLLDFPGKTRLQRWLAAQPWVFKPINWYREKKGVEPLIHPDDAGNSAQRSTPQSA